MYDLGLTDEQFWDLTPRAFSLLWNRHIEAERRVDRRVASLICLYANSHRDRQLHPKPFEVDEFLPGSAAATSEQTAKNNVVQMVAQAKALTLAAKAKREKLTPYQVVMAAREMATA